MAGWGEVGDGAGRSLLRVETNTTSLEKHLVLSVPLEDRLSDGPVILLLGVYTLNP